RQPTNGQQNTEVERRCVGVSSSEAPTRSPRGGRPNGCPGLMPGLSARSSTPASCARTIAKSRAGWLPTIALRPSILELDPDGADGTPTPQWSVIGCPFSVSVGEQTDNREPTTDNIRHSSPTARPRR